MTLVDVDVKQDNFNCLPCTANPLKYHQLQFIWCLQDLTLATQQKCICCISSVSVYIENLINHKLQNNHEIAFTIIVIVYQGLVGTANFRENFYLFIFWSHQIWPWITHLRTKPINPTLKCLCSFFTFTWANRNSIACYQLKKFEQQIIANSHLRILCRCLFWLLTTHFMSNYCSWL